MEEEKQIIWVEETASTNSLLRNYIEQDALPSGSVVVADFQTAGRGQVGFSLVYAPCELPINQQFLVSQIAAWSVKEALDAYLEGISIKWPNDIYWNDKKICGMLIENELWGHNLRHAIIGIGINVNQAAFKGGAPNPVSMIQLLGRETDRMELLQRFLACFDRYQQALAAGEKEWIRQRYMAALYRGEGYHSYRDAQGAFSARIQGIEPMGYLLLEDTEGSVRRYAFKEVSFVL